MTDIKKFQEVIGYHFHDEKLLRQALTHSSFANEKHLKKHSDNERLEFLGDAVLEIIPFRRTIPIFAFVQGSPPTAVGTRSKGNSCENQGLFP